MRQDDDREVVRFRLTPPYRDALDRALEEKGLTIQAFYGRLSEWVLDQDSLFISVLLGQVPTEEDLVELILRRRAKRPEKKGGGSR